MGRLDGRITEDRRVLDERITENRKDLDNRITENRKDLDNRITGVEGACYGYRKKSK